MAPKKTAKNGRNELGKFTEGNPGKPKGATHKTTTQLRESIVHFLLDKSDTIHEIWEQLDPKDQATLFLHLSKLVMPAISSEPESTKPLPAPKIIVTRKMIDKEGIEREIEDEYEPPKTKG